MSKDPKKTAADTASAAALAAAVRDMKPRISEVLKENEKLSASIDEFAALPVAHQNLQGRIHDLAYELFKLQNALSRLETQANAAEHLDVSTAAYKKISEQ